MWIANERNPTTLKDINTETVCLLTYQTLLELPISQWASKSVFCMSSNFPGGSVVKNLPANAGDARDIGSTPGSGRSPGVGNGNPCQYSCLENPTDRGAWWATVRGS